jgi:acylphosphatase
MTQNDNKRIHLRITGRVQGVGFRWFVVAEGRRLGIGGWVRNNPDGSVELEAEGPPAALSSLRARVGKGPSAARVDQVHELSATDRQLPARFETVR